MTNSRASWRGKRWSVSSGATGPRNTEALVATVADTSPVPIPTFADPRAVARWLRSWLAGEAVGTWGALYGLGEADCVAAVAAVGWPVPGNGKALALVEELERRAEIVGGE